MPRWSGSAAPLRRARGGHLRQLAVRMGGVEAAAAADRWNALLGDVRAEVAADDTLYARTVAAVATARRTLFDDVHQAVEAVAAGAGVRGAARRGGLGGSCERFDGRALDGPVPDPFAALDRAFATEAAATSLANAAVGGNESAVGSVPDPFAALERAFAAQAAEAVTEDPGNAESAAVVGTVEAANRAAWVASVDAAVATAAEAETAAAGPGRWMSRNARCVGARNRLAAAIARVEALTVGGARPQHVPGATGEEAYAKISARIEAADERGRRACESIERPR